MSEFHDDRSFASDAQPISLSDAKLRRLEPDLYGWRAWFSKTRWGLRQLTAREARRMLAEHLRLGDTRAAVVVRTDPLTVAAYTDEQDAVLLLRFPQFLAVEHDLAAGSRLLTVNTYALGKRMMPDLVEGPATTRRYVNFFPVIADFVSDDLDLIDRRKRAIPEAEWRRTAHFAKLRLSEPGVTFRDGRPLRSNRPANPAGAAHAG
jgi:hypothetical protein